MIYASFGGGGGGLLEDLKMKQGSAVFAFIANDGIDVGLLD